MSDRVNVRSSLGSTALAAAELADPDLRRSLTRMARRGVPPQEVDDIVQDALAEALSARADLREPRHLRHWLGGVVRHKVVDYHRRSGREQVAEPPEGACNADEGAGRDLLRWAEQNLPNNRTDQQTFEWLLREGDGERLEEIARSEAMPAERVRQRVARLRRHLRERWAQELAAAAAAAIAATFFGALLWLISRPAAPEIAHPFDPPAPPRNIDYPAPPAQRLRAEALDRCASGDHRSCLDGLDRAAALDPEGDRSDEVQRARREAEKALKQPPPAPTAPPSPSASPQGANRFGKVNAGRLTSDTAPQGRCVCSKGDPLCSCF